MLQSPAVATIVVGVGYIGSRLVQELLYQGREVIGIDNLFASDRRAVEAFRQSDGFRFVEGSIVDPSTMERALAATTEVESVFLLAAQASAHPDAASAEYTEDTNLRGPRVVLDALTRHDVSAPVVYASSVRVYGAPLPPVVDETTPYGALTDLSHLSKCYGEKLIEMYAVTRRLVGRVVRLGLTYGVAPVLKTDRRFMTAPNLFSLQAARGEPLEVRSPHHFALIHVDDAVDALLCAGERVDASGCPVFNAASDVASLAEVAEHVRQAADARELAVTVVQRSAAGLDVAPRPTIHSSLASRGFSPRRQLGEGIAETLDHFLVQGQ